MGFTVLNPTKRKAVPKETPAEEARRKTAESVKRFLDRHIFVRGEPRPTKAAVRSRHQAKREVYHRISSARGTRAVFEMKHTRRLKIT